MASETFVPGCARSVAHLPLPGAPAGSALSLLLFYAYQEPRWTKKEHKQARAKVLELGKRFEVHGRGRCAREGLNCTMTGLPEDIRAFCRALRAWKPQLFNATDFKIDDSLRLDQHFKALTVRKVDELVAYKLGTDRKHVAPSLQHSAGTHVEADEFHKMLAEDETPTVVLDVRNVYESTVGHFQPSGKAVDFVPIPMQNSQQFAPWLADPKTKSMLQDKRVMMYCTGGIRCERASALLNEMTEADPSFKTNGVFELRGGIHRYMTAYPEGGHWLGKNYVFDRRMEQVPALKTEPDVALSCCSSCRAPWDVYRGSFKCAGCACPILVCDPCRFAIEGGGAGERGGAGGAVGEDGEASSLAEAPDVGKLKCDLCRVGYVAPTKRPKLKRKMSSSTIAAAAMPSKDFRQTKKTKKGEEEKEKRTKAAGDDDAIPRLYCAKLPFMVSFKDVQTALSGAIGCKPRKIKYAEWKYDRKTRLFYGTAFVLVEKMKHARRIIDASTNVGIMVQGKRIKVALAGLKAGESMSWPNGAEQDARPKLPQ